MFITALRFLADLLGIQTIVLTAQRPFIVVPWKHEKTWQWAVVSIWGPAAIFPTRQAAQWLCDEYLADVQHHEVVAAAAALEQA